MRVEDDLVEYLWLDKQWIFGFLEYLMFKKYNPKLDFQNYWFLEIFTFILIFLGVGLIQFEVWNLLNQFALDNAKRVKHRLNRREFLIV